MIPKGVQNWERIGCILQAKDMDVPWLRTHTGASVAWPSPDGDVFDVYITGRDEQNRSMIGRASLLMSDRPRIVDIQAKPVLGLGQHGTYDENGVSYPCLFEYAGRLHMLFTGWVPGVLTPFQNDLGLAVQEDDGRFERVSKAPILSRDDDDYLGIGSSFALCQDGLWHLWYTSFRSWGSTPDEPKHQYWIKHATGKDPLSWERRHVTSVGLGGSEEYVVCRPSVVVEDGVWHMWFCARGDYYQLGYASSVDGQNFDRCDDYIQMARPANGFDSNEQSYPHVFRHKDALYMLYCGNGYGRDGLGLARLPLK